MDNRVLSIAGSDCGGGAGIQADVKTITILGGFACTAITAITAQNTQGVDEVSLVDPLLVERQVELVLEDIGVDAVKTGMLGSRTTVELVARQLERRAPHTALVVDPVMVSSSGKSLLDEAGRIALRDRLLPMSALITPNVEEAQWLTAVPIEDEGGMHAAADVLLLRGASAVLITGGHLPGEQVVDLLRTADGLEYRFERDRLDTKCTHGSGCTLSAAIATGLGQGLTLHAAVQAAVEFVRQAMSAAIPLGSGSHAPMDHGFCFRRPAEAQIH